LIAYGDSRNQETNNEEGRKAGKKNVKQPGPFDRQRAHLAFETILLLSWFPYYFI
jgi:hypothetical protein